MNPTSQPLRFVELTGLQDDLLLSWLDLYETAFPAAERVLVSKHLLALKGTPDEPGEHHLMAAVTEDKSFAGLARYQVLPEMGLAYLWYLATAAELRNQGVGSRFYQEIVQRVAGPAVQANLLAMAIEVEIPERASEAEGAGAGAEHAAAEQALAERRIAFYRRQGSRMLEGIHYLQTVGPHQAPIPMHIMFHAFGPLDAAQAFALARRLWGDQVGQVGALRLS